MLPTFEQVCHDPIRVRSLLRANCDVNGQPVVKKLDRKVSVSFNTPAQPSGMLDTSVVCMSIAVLQTRWCTAARYVLSTLRIAAAFLFLQFGTAKWFAFPGSPTCGGLAVKDTVEFRHVSVSINRSWNDVYDFVSNGDNFGQWASGLGQKFRRAGNEWLAEGPLGTVKVRIVKRNEFGVADHDVVLETGVTVHNPIRVIPNGTGSTVTFTLLRMAGVSAHQFNDDAKAVEKDLLLLKAVLEKQ